MFRVTFFIVFLFVNQVVSPQNLTDLFKSELFEKTFRDKSSINTINDNIEYLVMLNPKILYYYFDHLDRLFNKNYLRPDSIAVKELKQARIYYSIKRSNWANYHIEQIGIRITNRLMKNAAESEFEEIVYSFDDSNVFLPEGAQNKMEYLAYKYFKLDGSLKYEPNNNYRQLNSSFLRSKIEDINNQIAVLQNTSDESFLKLINEIKQYWFIENDYPEVLKSNPMIKEPYLIALDYYSDKFYETTKPIVFVEQNLTFLNYNILNEKMVYKDYVLPTFIEPMKFEYDIKIKSIPLFTLGFGYKIKLKEAVGIFSNINTSISYTYLTNNITSEPNEKDFYKFTYNVISGSIIEQYVYHISNVTNLSNHLISLRFNTPVYYFSKRLYIEGGIGLDYHIFNYDMEVYRSLVRVTNGDSEVFGKEDRGNNGYNRNKISIVPSFSLKYNFTDDFNLTLTSLGNFTFPRATIGLEILF
jgi:hypothetical protein